MASTNFEQTLSNFILSILDFKRQHLTRNDRTIRASLQEKRITRKKGRMATALGLGTIKHTTIGNVKNAGKIFIVVS